MFLLSLLSAALIGNGEKVKGNYKAYKYNKKGGFYAEYPCFKPKNKK